MSYGPPAIMTSIGHLRLLFLSVLPLLPSITASINIDGCKIEVNSPEAVGSPYYKEKPVHGSIYSCLPSHNCDYSIHVISIYEADSRHKTYYHPTRSADVYLNMSGSGDTRPLVLVLASHEPINWTLHIPANRVIDKVIVSSTLDSSVSNKDQVLEVERDLHLYGYGSDSGGGQTQKLLQVLSQRLGPITSFTGTYQADKWILNINNTFSDASCLPIEVSVGSSAETGLGNSSTILVLYGGVAIVTLVFIFLVCVITVLQIHYWRKKAHSHVDPSSNSILHNRDHCKNPYEQDLPKYYEIMTV